MDEAPEVITNSSVDTGAPAPALPYRRPNKVLRLAMVFGIIAAVAGGNYLLNLPPPPPPPPPPERKLPYPALELEASTWINTNGKPVRLLDWKDKVVLIEFWRFNCHACQATIPFIKEMEKKYAKQGLVVVGVHSGMEDQEQDVEAIRKYLRDQRITVPTAVDNDRRNLTAIYRYEFTTPTFLLINRKGNVVDYRPSSKVGAEIEKEIKRLLAGEDLEKEAAGKTSLGPLPAAGPDAGKFPPPPGDHSKADGHGH